MPRAGASATAVGEARSATSGAASRWSHRALWHGDRSGCGKRAHGRGRSSPVGFLDRTETQVGVAYLLPSRMEKAVPWHEQMPGGPRLFGDWGSRTDTSVPGIPRRTGSRCRPRCSAYPPTNSVDLQGCIAVLRQPSWPCTCRSVYRQDAASPGRSHAESTSRIRWMPSPVMSEWVQDCTPHPSSTRRLRRPVP